MSDSFATPWTATLRASLSMGFSRQEYWSGLPCPPPGDLPNPGIEPASLASPALAGRFFITNTTWENPKRERGEWKVCLIPVPDHHPLDNRSFPEYINKITFKGECKSLETEKSMCG